MTLHYADGLTRCWWGAAPEIYVDYHDNEWGRPVVDDHRLFEKLCLEGFQAGLSWLTILKKRPAFRDAFADFDPQVVAGFDPGDVARLLENDGIVRHRGKIESAVSNAHCALAVIEEHGSLADYFWSGYGQPTDTELVEPPALTPASKMLANDLKRRGFRFVGPITVYAFMQAMGLVNDHLPGCDSGDRCEAERNPVLETYRRR